MVEHPAIAWSHHINCYLGLSYKKERNIYSFCYILQRHSWLLRALPPSLPTSPRTFKLSQDPAASSRRPIVVHVKWRVFKLLVWPEPTSSLHPRDSSPHTHQCPPHMWFCLLEARQRWIDATVSEWQMRRCLPLLKASCYYYRSETGRRFQQCRVQLSGCLLEDLHVYRALLQNVFHSYNIYHL
jgi:hypothetical protein